MSARVAPKRKRVAFFSGPAWEPWNAASPATRGIGGSETCLVHLSAELAKLGYEVTLFIDTEGETKLGGVHYVPYREFPRFAEHEPDVFVHYRNTRALELAPRAALRIGFAQDVTLSTGAQHGSAVLGDQLDFLFSLSRAHTERLSQTHAFPRERIKMTANGVEPSRYLAEPTKRRAQVFFSSCPSRDLDFLLAASVEIARQVPDFRLVVAYGLQTWEGLLRQGRGDYRKYFFTLDMMKSLPWVQFLGRINQRALAQLQLESSAWFYPTSFPETFCITAAEAGFARCPILASSVFGLPTTIGNGGILLEGDPAGAAFREAFIQNAIRLLTDPLFSRDWAHRARERMLRFTWANVARQWHDFFETGLWREIQ